jgi:hypothetical protein
LTDFSPIGGIGFDGAGATPIGTYQWGNDVLGIGNIGATNSALVGPRYFSRASFEAWLVRVLSAIGAP